MAAINVNLSCDLQKPIKVQYLDGILFSQDNQANIINVEVLNGGEPATISGNVTANVIRSDGGTVAVTGGSISDNVCSIALPSAAYYVPGVVSIVVKLTTSGVITTIAAVVANVYQSSTDTIVDPGTIIPSIQTLISSIETAVASIPADYSSLWTSLAPAFNSSANYVAGQYVTYNGGVYMFTTTHSGSWASSDVIATNLGNGLSDLKSAFDIANTSAENNIEQVTGNRALVFKRGKYASATGTGIGETVSYSDSTLYVCAISPCSPGDVFVAHVYGYSGVNRAYFICDSNMVALSRASSSEEVNGKIYITNSSAAYIVFTNRLSSLESGYYVYKANNPTLRAEDTFIKNAIGDITGNKIIDNWSKLDLYITTNGTTADTSSPATSAGSHARYIVAACSAGDKFIVTATGTSSARAWTFIDSEGNILSRSGSNATLTNREIIAPTSAAYLIVNDLSEQGRVIKNEFIKSSVDSLCTNVDALNKDAYLINNYLFATDKYIDASGDLQNAFGWNLYKFPFNNNIIYVGWDEITPFWLPSLSFSDSFVFVLVDSNGDYVSVPAESNTNPGMYFKRSVRSYALFNECEGLYTHLIVCCHKDMTSTAKINLFDNQPGIISESGMEKVDVYIDSNYKFIALSSGATSYITGCRVGDMVRKPEAATALNYNYALYSSSGYAAIRNTNEYTVTADGVLFVFDDSGVTNAVFVPFDYTKDPVNTLTNRYGVAFGTSLTKFAESSDGYLDFLPGLSGIQFDNKGVGNSQILPASGYHNILNEQVKAYESYSDKTVCILEGFVNDWVRNGTNLGTWQDDTETTVCGCVRSAINYIYSQNASIRLFMILDHYGKSGAINCSSTATNDAGQTQYEFYEEIAKVAESMGVPVIKEYAISGISERAPQFLKDNIHLNELGARQSANAIWSEMKQHFAFVV